MPAHKHTSTRRIYLCAGVMLALLATSGCGARKAVGVVTTTAIRTTSAVATGAVDLVTRNAH